MPPYELLVFKKYAEKHLYQNIKVTVMEAYSEDLRVTRLRQGSSDWVVMQFSKQKIIYLEKKR